MSRLKILQVLGIAIVVLPYLGFPYIFRNAFITLSGFSVIYLSYLLQAQDKDKEGENKETPTFENFSENHDFIENNIRDN